jgi:hypothetical protein
VNTLDSVYLKQGHQLANTSSVGMPARERDDTPIHDNHHHHLLTNYLVATHAISY